MSVNINVTATGAQAAGKQIADFTNQSAAGLIAMARAAQQASAGTEVATSKILSNNRALKSAIGGLALNATLFAGPQAQQFIYPLILMQKELKGLTSAAKIAGLSLPAVGLAVAGVTAAVATGVFWWQKYKAEMQEIDSEIASGQTAGNISDRFEKLIEANRARLNPGEADAMLARLFTHNSKGDTEAFPEISARLKQVVLNADELKKIDELKKKTVELNDAKREGFDKERAEEQNRFLRETAFIEERQKIAKTKQDHTDVLTAYDLNRELKAKTLADIEKRQAAEVLKTEQERTEEIRKREQTADEFYAREDEHERRMLELARQKQLDRIQSSPFLNESEKYNQTAAMSEDMSNIANPNSLPEQMLAGWKSFQTQFGTVAQNVAATMIGTIGTAIDSISSGITGLITGTISWGQALKNIAGSIINELIKGFVKTLVSWLFVEDAKTEATVAGAGVRSTAALGEAGAEAVSTGAKAAGSVADIPYVGWALAIAAFGSIIAMIATASSNARAMGGPVNANMPYLVGERGPEMFVPKEHGDIINNSRTMQIMNNSRDAGAAPIGAAAPQIHFAIINSHSDLKRWIEGTEGRKIIYDVVNNRRLDLGFPT